MRKNTWEEAVRSLIDDPSKHELVVACYFDPPLGQAAKRFVASEEWQAMRDIIGPGRGQTALDIGAGNGIVSYALAIDGWKVIAVEPDPSNLVGADAIRTLARDTGVEIEVRSGTGEKIPMESDRVDLVVARQVLHHATDLPAFAKEISRVLKPQGRLVSTRDHVVSNEKQLALFLQNHPLHYLYGGEYAYSISEYRSAMLNANMIITKQLNSLESVINTAPKSLLDVCIAIAKQFGPFEFLLNGFLKIPFLQKNALTLASKFDRRPGRLISLVCEKSSYARTDI